MIHTLLHTYKYTHFIKYILTYALFITHTQINTLLHTCTLYYTYTQIPTLLHECTHLNAIQKIHLNK